MIRFIDEHKDHYGVEAICRVLREDFCEDFYTSRDYRAFKSRPPSARALRDEELIEELKRLHADNFGVYGIRKLHQAMVDEGHDIGCDQVGRLMKIAGLKGVRRGRNPVTTKPAKQPDSRPDLVKRNFTADAPSRLWVADITYVRTRSGFVYTAFVTDAFSRKIVGWSTKSSLSAVALPMEALSQAIHSAKGQLDGPLVHHSDRGSQGGFNWLSQHPEHGGVSIVYNECLEEHGISASTGTVGDSYDNALAENVNGPSQERTDSYPHAERRG
ncbi:transposase [Corynebacterium diphtheriae]|nr:transposase [Corynebacterium diphtheriae]CAB1011706.1 transposase [Corynebacterium diphtheriae]